MKTKIVSGFPGIGKSTIFKNFPHIKCVDSDSSQFSWSSPGIRHSDFPNNYIDHIKSLIGKVDFIFVSTHQVVRKALQDNNLLYWLVYPNVELKEQYIKNYIGRGNDDKFVSMMKNNFEKFIKECQDDPTLFKIELTFDNPHLIDVIKKIR